MRKRHGSSVSAAATQKHQDRNSREASILTHVFTSQLYTRLMDNESGSYVVRTRVRVSFPIYHSSSQFLAILRSRVLSSCKNQRTISPLSFSLSHSLSPTTSPAAHPQPKIPKSQTNNALPTPLLSLLPAIALLHPIASATGSPTTSWRANAWGLFYEGRRGPVDE